MSGLFEFVVFFLIVFGMFVVVVCVFVLISWMLLLR